MENKQNISKMPKSKIVRYIFILLGCITFVLGTIGIVLPILPTTPFYLLTAFFWVKGSYKFSNWFLNSNLYKKHMNTFAKHKVMIWYKELILLLLVSCLLITTMLILNNKVMNIIFPCLIGLKYFYFVLFVKPISKEEYLRLRNIDLENYEVCA